MDQKYSGCQCKVMQIVDHGIHSWGNVNGLANGVVEVFVQLPSPF